MAGAGYSLGSALTFVLVLNVGAVIGAVGGGWLADVFVVAAAQGHGLGTWLVGCVAEAASEINRLQLGTRDAHGLYAKFGFTPHSFPHRAMERLLLPLAPD